VYTIAFEGKEDEGLRSIKERSGRIVAAQYGKQRKIVVAALERLIMVTADSSDALV
jgi:hypothetical protein